MKAFASSPLASAYGYKAMTETSKAPSNFTRKTAS
jgi:hypothetical protein